MIDTIVRGKPIPKIILMQSLKGARNMRVVVDGQQRLRTILEFYDNSFRINRVHNKEFGGMYFDDLPPDLQNEFQKYELGVDVVFDASYEDLLDIFARINSYTVSLNKQEIFNAKYVGYFKHLVFQYGIKYVKYFLDSSVLTKAGVARMAEAEMTADLIVALVDAPQSNKTIENFYKKYEEEEGECYEAGDKFDLIMSYIGTIYPIPDLAGTNWKRTQLFYTLFTTIGHLLYGLNDLDEDVQFSINEKMIGKLRFHLDEFSARYDEIAADMNNENFPKDFKEFINLSRRGTTDTSVRIKRTNFLCEYLKSSIEQ